MEGAEQGGDARAGAGGRAAFLAVAVVEPRVVQLVVAGGGAEVPDDRFTAADEQRDYQLIDQDFTSVGGAVETLHQTGKNVGSEALSGFIFYRAGLPDPVDLVGAMFVIEGLGVRKAARWAEQLARTLKLRRDQLSFLRYHGENDAGHFERLEEIVRRLSWDETRAARTVKTARVVARLYALQLEEVSAG